MSKALEQSVFVVPVLVDNAAMPQSNQLPESMRSLASHNAVKVRDDPDFNGDIDRLFVTLRSRLFDSSNRTANFFSKKALLTALIVILMVGIGLTLTKSNFDNFWNYGDNTADYSMTSEKAVDKEVSEFITNGTVSNNIKEKLANCKLNGVSPDGSMIAVVAEKFGHRVRIIDAASGLPIFDFNLNSPVGSVCFSPDGKKIITTGLENVAYIWEFPTAKRSMTIKGREGMISAAFS